MAVILLDGCDHYNSTILAAGTGPYQVTNSAAISAGNGRFGGNAMTLGTVQRIFASSQVDLIQGCWVKELNGAHGGNLFTHVNGNGQARCALSTNSLGGFALLNGHNATLGTSTQYLFPFGQWNWVVWKIHYSNGSGTSDVYVNGTNVWSLSGINTNDDFLGGSALGADAASFKSDGNFVTRYMDDTFIFNLSGAVANSVPNPLKFVTSYLNGAGAFTQFSPNGAATNWQAASETPPDEDTSYNSSATASNRDSFTHGAVSGITSVIASQISVRARIDDAGPHTMNVTGRATGTDLIGAAQTVSGSYAEYLQDFSSDPSTSALWASVSAFNASEIGYELAS